eukprot:1723650-Prymnesium_polylepis.1
MTRKGREQSRGPLVPFRHAIPEPYMRKTPLGAPTYVKASPWAPLRAVAPAARTVTNLVEA